MTLIDDIIAARRSHRFFDEELWDFLAKMQGPLLENASDNALQLRLTQIEKNIQYLDEAPGERKELPPERGWLSPWFWLRLRHWTLAEMAARSIAPARAIGIKPMPLLNPEFRGLHAGGSKLLIRISRLPWLLETLELGRLRFSPASAYCMMENDEARADDEMAKTYRRSGSVLTITGPDGQRINPIGDVVVTSRRVSDDYETEIPYWLMCFSTDLDPRLFADFPSGEGDDAVLVIFDPIAFIRRAQPHLNRVAPLSDKRLHQVEYYDSYHPPSHHLSPVTMKECRFAYQREWRLILDCGGREVLAGGGVLSVDIGSITDIAAVYAPDGRLIAGTGPATFLADPAA